MTRNIDELSNLTTQKAEPPEEYFGKMDLNEEQVEKRLQYTKKANELFDVILILLLTMNERGETNFFYAKSLLESWMLSLVAEFTTPDDYLIDYVSDAVYNFVETTNNHIDDPWYTSSDRALYNAENGANDVLNYTEYKEAIEEGKTEKRWITETDNRVRKSHKAVTKKPIPIKDYFRVGMAKMRFPKDYELADAFPEELINCRCTIEYLPKDENFSEENAKSKQNRLDNNINNGIIKEESNVAFYGEPIQRSLGAKTRNYPNVTNPFTGEPFEFVPNSIPEYPTDYRIAGKGTKKPIKIIDYLLDTYGGKREDWSHLKAFFQVYDETGDIRQISVHWFDCGDGLRYEEKVKLYNNAMYRDEYDKFEKYF